jgi:FkbM family methyltransferase
MTIPSVSHEPHRQHAVSYVPHVGWLSHQYKEELITLLHRGYFEAAEQAFFWLYLRSGDCFIDCGAHIGLYSLIAHQATEGKIELVSIEADSKTFSYLKENLKRTGLESTTLVNAAVWNRPGEIGFVDAGSGKAAYSHVVFEDTTATHPEVRAVTLDEIVSAVSVPQITLVKIDVEGAEPEVLSGGAQVIAAQCCPLIMIEFTEANLARRGITSIRLARQLESLGYELCEFSTEALELLPFQVEGPIWYKNLFACIDRVAVNSRLRSACSVNKQIAQDILERARACSLHAELEELNYYKTLASLATEYKEWAERTEQFLVQERQTNADLRAFVQRVKWLYQIYLRFRTGA